MVLGGTASPGGDAGLLVQGGGGVQPAPGTARSSVATLINSSVGAGVLSFPYAFRQLGWAAGVAALVVIAGVEAFTLYVLSRYAEHARCTTYSSLVRKMLGRGPALLMIAVLILYPFGSCVAYLIITGDSFQPLLRELFGQAWFTSRAAIIAGVGTTCMLPLCFRTRLGALASVSALCIWGLLVVAGVIVFRSAQIVGGPGYDWGAVKAFNPSGLDFLSALVLIIFGFQCHTNVVSVFEELEPHPAFFRGASSAELAGAAGAAGPVAGPASPAAAEDGAAAAPPPTNGRQPKTEKLLGMIRVVLLSISVTAAIYGTVGIAGYLAFPSTAKSDIMLSFQDDFLIKARAAARAVARATVGLIMVAAYPVNHFPVRGAIRDLAQQLSGRSVGGPGFVAAETLAFFASTLAVALVFTDLGSILKLVGGTCGNVLIFLMPGLLLIEYAASKHRDSHRRWRLHAEASFPLVGEEDGGVAPPPLYRLWASKLFWAGVLLLLISGGLLMLTLVTTLRPLPADS